MASVCQSGQRTCVTSLWLKGSLSVVGCCQLYVSVLLWWVTWLFTRRDDWERRGECSKKVGAGRSSKVFRESAETEEETESRLRAVWLYGYCRMKCIQPRGNTLRLFIGASAFNKTVGWGTLPKRGKHLAPSRANNLRLLQDGLAMLASGQCPVCR